MTIKVKANGVTFSFPDGTTHAEIEQVLDEHFNPPGAIEAFFTEAGKSVAAGAAKMADSAVDILVPDVVKAGAAMVLPEGVYNAYFEPEKALDNAGLTPETTAGKVAAEIIPALAGGFGGSAAVAPRVAKIGNKYLRWTADNLASSLGAQVASGNDVSATTTAGDVGLGVLLNAAAPKVGTALKFVLRGNREGEVLDAVQTINASLPDGTDFTPSRAMLTDSTVGKFAEKHLESVWGAAHQFKAFNEANQAALDEFADQLRKGMAPGEGMDSQAMGDALAAGFKAFIDSGRNDAEKYFTAAIQRAGNHRIALNESKKLLNSLYAVIRDNPGYDDVLAASEFDKVSTAIRNGKGLTLQGVIKLRSKVRAMMDNPGVGVKSSDDRDLALLYDAISNDITHSLDAGAPMGALGAWREGNRAWSAFQNDLKQVRQIFEGVSGDTLYARVFGKPSDGLTISNADRVRAILGVLPEDMQRRVKSEMVWRAGREAMGQAGNEGQKFSAAAFLTNWNKLKANGLGDLLAGQHAEDISALALVSHRLKELGRAANHSNTANHAAAGNLMQAAAGLATGGTSLIGTTLLANLSARALLNPEFAQTLWKMASASQNDAGYVRDLIRLAVIAEQDPETAVDFEILTGEVSGQ